MRNYLSKGTILYLGAELPDKDAASHRILANAKIFREMGYEVVLLGDSKDNSIDSSILRTEFSFEGFRCFLTKYPKNTKQRIQQIIGVKDIVTVAETLPDLRMIILYNHPSISLLRMKRYCNKRKIKIIADVTEWYSGRGHGFVYFMIKSADTSFRMRIIHKRLDGLIVISKYLKQYYRKVSNVITIPPLNDLSHEYNSPYHSRKDGYLRLVYAGSPGNKDKLEVLINGIKNCKTRIKLDIVGITQEDFNKRNPQIDYNEDVVLFHGRVSHKTALEFVRKADFSCFFREVNRVSMAGFPTKFAEAISCGTPVITNRTSDLSDYIKNGRNGYFVEKLNEHTISALLDSIGRDIPVDTDLFNYKKYIDVVDGFFRELMQ